MEELKQQPRDNNAALDELMALVEKAARAIEQLRAENASLTDEMHRRQMATDAALSALEVREQRIKELEESERALQPAADRHQRMKARCESLPEAQGGFAAHGVTYKTFDEAFDAAYPAKQVT
jgi:chromosome segregation ATPase